MKDPKRLEKYQRYHTVFSTGAGQSILADLKRFCNYDNSSLVVSIADGKVDPYYTAAQEGKRQVILHILGCLKEPPEIMEGESEDQHNIRGDE